MLECRELIGGDSDRLNCAMFLKKIEPLSVLDSDLKPKDVLKVYHLIAKDEHGVFGTVILSERSIKHLPNSYKKLASFKGEKTYFELSLSYSEVPTKLEGYDPEDEDLLEKYCKIFYVELFCFFRKMVHQKGIVVNSTEEEIENMETFGLWSFEEKISTKNNIFAVLPICLQNEVFFNQFEKKETIFFETPKNVQIH